MTSLTKCLILFLSLFMLTACDSSDSNRDDITSLALTPSNAYVNLNGTQTYTLVATYSDNSTATVTNVANWSSSDTAIATIDTGVAIGIDEGETLITTTINGISASANLYVANSLPESLILSNNSNFLITLAQEPITATLLNDNGTTEDISTDDDLIISIEENNCFSITTTEQKRIQAQQGEENCQATILGQYRNMTALSSQLAMTYIPTKITNIGLTPKTQRSPVGIETQYKVLIQHDNGEIYNATKDTNIRWSSSHPNVATINDTGYVESIAAGNTTITATFYDHSISTIHTVTTAQPQSIDLLPKEATIGNQASQAYTAIVTYTDNTTKDVTHNSSTTFQSSDKIVAIISNTDINKGVAKALSSGNTDISVMFSNLKANATLFVSSAQPEYVKVIPQNQILSKGDKQNYQAILVYDNGFTEDITDKANTSWQSKPAENTTVINGLVSAIEAGSAEIIVTYQTLDGSILQGSTTANINTASPSYITVTPQNLHLGLNAEQAYSASVTYSNGWTRDITTDPNLSWSVANGNIAFIDDTGTGTIITEGNTEVQATFRVDANTALTHTSPLFATNATPLKLSIINKNHELPTGTERQFYAELTFDDDTVIDVTNNPQLFWSSDNNIASIQQGTLKANSSGTATLTATYILDENTALSDTSSLTIVDATPYQLTLTADTQTVGLTSELQYRATLWYSEGMTADVTYHPNTYWQSSDPDIATIEQGYVNTFNAGNTNITAYYQFDNDTRIATSDTQLTVSSTSPSSLAISLSDDTTEALTSNIIDTNNDDHSRGTFIEQAYTAILTFDDNSTMDVTHSDKLAWFTDETQQTVAISFDNKAYTQTSGNTHINAFYQGSQSINLYDNSALTVNGSLPTNISITVDNELYEGNIIQLQAYAHYDNGTPSQNITQHASSYWSSSDNGTLTISNQTNAKGLAYGEAVGDDITITLTFLLPDQLEPLTTSITRSVLEDKISGYWITNVENEVYDKNKVNKTISMSTNSNSTLYAYLHFQSGIVRNVSDITQWCVSTQEESTEWCTTNGIATITQGETEYNQVTIETNTQTNTHDSPADIRARLPLEYIDVTPSDDLTHVYVTPLFLVVE
ncbi:Ig-like domain-containing protein [uncultured Shewanella sp.]|uniref:Ig-like domain-containing protein n=1 Tax=uncultured Shewanella sp. TaxID=173975 RepID=UPI00262883D4|nr:Ig-like domain-containing protein [uncultured Shewanella sp.]